MTDWTEFVLMVKNVKTKDAGAYQCQVYIAPYGQKDLHMLAILQPFLLKDGGDGLNDGHRMLVR